MDNESVFQVCVLGALSAIIGAVRFKTKTKRKTNKVIRNRRIWVKDIYSKRNQFGLFHNLIAEMRRSDPELFFNFTRMSISSFDFLLSICGPQLKKYSPREAIQPGVRLMVTLRFLATGDSYPSLAYAFRIHKSTICNIIRETCDVLWEVLSPIYLKKPTREELLKISQEFYQIWQLPNCLGSIDGKHMRIRAPANSGSQFYNYKKYYSIILLAVCDAKYNFTYVDVGSYGAQSDGGVLKHSTFGKMLFNDELDIPKSNPLPGTNNALPLFFIGDEAFPLHVNLLRPYSKRRSTRMPEEEQIFNYRLSRARRTIENTLGIMVARFRIFHREINGDPKTVDGIVKASTCLHNFIRAQKQDTNLYCNNSFADREVNGEVVPGEWRNEIPLGNALGQSQIRFGNRNAAREAWSFRNLIKDYLNSPVGSNVCPWQLDYIRRTN